MTDIKPIESINKQNAGERLGEHYKKVITFNWVFSKWYEKIILLASLSWSFFSIYKYVRGLF